VNGVATSTFNFSATNLVEANAAINGLSDITGVSSEITAEGIRLKHAQGGDIIIENMEASANLSVRKISADGKNYVGPAVALQGSGNNDSTRVTWRPDAVLQ
jgi:hypothetical protein